MSDSATSRCPACQSPHVVRGALPVTDGDGHRIAFRPEGLADRLFARADVELRGAPDVAACLTCGTVWGFLARLELRQLLLDAGTAPVRTWAAAVPTTGRGTTPGTVPSR